MKKNQNTFYPNGKIKTEHLPDGDTKHYYPNGKIKKIAQNKNNYIIFYNNPLNSIKKRKTIGGHVIESHPNGKIKKITFQNGTMEYQSPRGRLTKIIYPDGLVCKYTRSGTKRCFYLPSNTTPNKKQ
ncbi:hypothetical protein [Candidatus Phytoplasma pruni]|uniref:Centromere protein J C-terminal domain-containing protein n=1 Tax=Candidatus Phytoplasma pruni TaxID=479893 RepID=A0A851HBR7_9MOLU|nr:hypothetical protein [Candidatus Phytoplasma pruni]NWN45525.1 hypothetical protein [Candidatus Phytoplasma pruni]